MHTLTPMVAARFMNICTNTSIPMFMSIRMKMDLFILMSIHICIHMLIRTDMIMHTGMKASMNTSMFTLMKHIVRMPSTHIQRMWSITTTTVD
ncbi:hypothetical protein [uncultured Pseudodesulfovibrio sp.]|uniref:hypothetical protein n=1 Tax=uncultured Pseudodesulfovibrio sp. TaxID=2035858 RepID=UPI0029C8C04A|nr:hypothetical protein [uncultured Pseudodesulfovibrio sp.]